MHLRTQPKKDVPFWQDQCCRASRNTSEPWSPPALSVMQNGNRRCISQHSGMKARQFIRSIFHRKRRLTLALRQSDEARHSKNQQDQGQNPVSVHFSALVKYHRCPRFTCDETGTARRAFTIKAAHKVLRTSLVLSSLRLKPAPVLSFAFLKNRRHYTRWRRAKWKVQRQREREGTETGTARSTTHFGGERKEGGGCASG